MVFTSVTTRKGVLDTTSETVGELRVDMGDTGGADDRMKEDLDTVRVSEEVKKHKWTCGRHKHRGCRGFSWKRIEDVIDGMQTDIEAGRTRGETKPSEFWQGVWDDMHNGGGGPPQNLPYSVLRNKWSALAEQGKSADEIWEILEREYPVPFLVVPLLKRWENLGIGKPIEEIRTNMFYGMEECNEVAIPERLREKYDLMKEDGRQDEFWTQNWDEVYAVKNFSERCCSDKMQEKGAICSKKRRDDEDLERFLYPYYIKAIDGEMKRIPPMYKQFYPLEYHPKMSRWMRKFSNRHLLPAVDERPFFKEFDFHS